jgi:predicted Ser/Thr protein kinase
MEDLTGKHLGPYQVVAPLGQGGMAAVYKAYQPNVDRYVALKILPRHFASDPQFVARFEQEAKVLAKLQHPHILPVHDYGAADGYTYIVMPFIQNGTLADLLKGRRLPLAQIGRIISQIGDALDYAHSRGLVHRDIKPSNVLLDERGNCLLTDFGIAKILEDNSNLTVTGGIMGTPAYMSPEQGRGEKVDHRTDIYALGVILYEMATGRVPYTAETAMAVMLKHINDPLPLPRTLNPALPEGLERVILKSLAKQPSDRFASAGEMVKAVLAETIRADVSADGKTAVGTPVENTIAVPTPQAGTRPKRSPWWVAGLVIGGAMLALLMCGLALAPQFIFSDQGPTATAIAQAQAATATFQTEAKATRTAEAQATKTAQAVATASANAQATVQAATAIALAERNTTATAIAAATSTAQTAPTATANAASTATAITQLTAIARNDDLLRDDFNSNRNNWTEAEFSDEYSDGARQIVGGKYRWWVRSKGDTNHWESVPGFFEKDLLGWFNLQVEIG